MRRHADHFSRRPLTTVKLIPTTRCSGSEYHLTWEARTMFPAVCTQSRDARQGASRRDATLDLPRCGPKTRNDQLVPASAGCRQEEAEIVSARWVCPILPRRLGHCSHPKQHAYGQILRASLSKSVVKSVRRKWHDSPLQLGWAARRLGLSLRGSGPPWSVERVVEGWKRILGEVVCSRLRRAAK